MINKQMTVGYIGNGKSANRYHIPFVLQRQDKIKIKMIYTLDHSRDIWDEIPGVFYTENLDELLNDKDIQVIVISTPSAFHYDYAKMLKSLLLIPISRHRKSLNSLNKKI